MASYVEAKRALDKWMDKRIGSASSTEVEAKLLNMCDVLQYSDEAANEILHKLNSVWCGYRGIIGNESSGWQEAEVLVQNASGVQITIGGYQFKLPSGVPLSVEAIEEKLPKYLRIYAALLMNDFLHYKTSVSELQNALTVQRVSGALCSHLSSQATGVVYKSDSVLVFEIGNSVDGTRVVAILCKIGFTWYHLANVEKETGRGVMTRDELDVVAKYNL